MKVLIIAGAKYDKILSAASSVFNRSIELYGLEYITDIRGYLNRGETFDRAVIFDKAYNIDGTDTDILNIKNRVVEFIETVKEMMPRYQLVFNTPDFNVGLGLVEVTSDLGDNAVIVHNDDGKVTKTLVAHLVSSSQDSLRNKYKLVTMQDLREFQIKNMKPTVIPELPEDTPKIDEPAVIGDVETVKSNYDPFGNEIDPFASEFTGEDPFGIMDKQELDGDTDTNMKDDEGGIRDIDSAFSNNNGYNDWVPDITPTGTDPFLDAVGTKDTDPFAISERTADDPFKSGEVDNDPFGDDNIINKGYEDSIDNEDRRAEFEESYTNEEPEHTGGIKDDISSELFADEFTDDTTSNDSNEIGALEDVDIEEEEPAKPKKGIMRGGRNKPSSKTVKTVKTDKTDKTGKNNAQVDKENVSNTKITKLKELMGRYKTSPAVITITGSHGSGKTTVAANMANMFCKMGYSVLVVDMDTSGRGQSYINYENYLTVHSSDTRVSAIKAALNSTSDRTGRYIDIIREGYHLIGTSLKVDKELSHDVLKSERLHNFLHNCRKSGYNLIIIDIPFETLIGPMKDLVGQSEYLLSVEKLNNHGLMNFMLNMMNIEDEQLLEDLFEKLRIVFNMEENCTSIFGKKVSSTSQVLEAVDTRVTELLGFEMDYAFSDLEVVDIINYNRDIEKYWFSKKFFSDVKVGETIFMNLIIKMFGI